MQRRRGVDEKEMRRGLLEFDEMWRVEGNEGRIKGGDGDKMRWDEVEVRRI